MNQVRHLHEFAVTFPPVVRPFGDHVDSEGQAMIENTLPTSTNCAEAAELLDFLLKIDNLKHVERETPTADARRRERTAEHCWHLAVAALVFADQATEPISLERALILALLHDLPETLAGDTYFFGPDNATRRQREAPALAELINRLSEKNAQKIVAAWEEFEFRKSPEARYVGALDSLLPVFLNFSGHRRSSWSRHNVTARQVRENIDRVRAALPRLAQMADAAIDVGVKNCYLKD